ncbi:IS30 family transposase [Chitinimonas lacunae]|uniref:IS30 family transposase n=1 Tax=Chitinimonas lacunae TaxID=1963018 RepID=A0ABV8MWX2_9NEIS
MTNHYSHLVAAERNQLQKSLLTGESLRTIARRMNRSVSTLSRELKRNAPAAEYDAVRAGQLAHRRRRRGAVKLKQASSLMNKVIDKLRQGWSPEQIAGRLPSMYPTDLTMRVCHETIYRTLYAIPRGELRKELILLLRKSHKSRLPRTRGTDRRSLIDMISIHDRPEEVLSRAIPGHWEGDLIKGAYNRSAVGTLVERTSRYVLLAKMTDATADAALEAFTRRLRHVPVSVRKTLTYDQGKEMAHHAELARRLKIQVYFADPHSPWQRPSNENMNGFIREYLPKGIDLSVFSQTYLNDIARSLNTRPRKCLGFRTPEEVFQEHINRLKAGVALQT